MWNTFIATVGPPFIGFLGLVVTAAIGLGVTYVRSNWLNNAAQSAFANAAGGIVNKLGEDLLERVLKPNDIEVLEAVDKVKDRIPDAVKSLGLSPAAIAERVVDHVGKLQAPAIGAMIQRMIPVPGSTMGAAMPRPPVPPASEPNFNRPGNVRS